MWASRERRMSSLGRSFGVGVVMNVDSSWLAVSLTISYFHLGALTTGLLIVRPLLSGQGCWIGAALSA